MIVMVIRNRIRLILLRVSFSRSKTWGIKGSPSFTACLGISDSVLQNTNIKNREYSATVWVCLIGFLSFAIFIKVI